jgi:hypothetical protein
VKQNVGLKEKELRIQTDGKCNDINNADDHQIDHFLI